MIHIWTDGSCDPDTRNGGWAAAIDLEEGDRVLHISGNVVDTTNNRMEYTAIIEALQWCYSMCKPEDVIVVHTDSELVVKHISGEYRVKKNRDLMERLSSWMLNEATPHVTLVHHKRNSNAFLQWADGQAKYERIQLDNKPSKLKLNYTP